MSALGELRRIKGTSAPKSRKQNKAAFLFLLPWFVGLALITVGPMVASFDLSFTGYNLLSPPRFIGIENYVRMLQDERLHTALAVTFTYVFVSVPLQLGARARARDGARPRAARAGASTGRCSTCRRCSARASRSRSCGARSSAPTASSTSVLALVRHRGPGLDLRPEHRARHADRAERLDVRRADGDLPGRAAADPRHVLRGGRRRRRRPLAAVPAASRCRCSRRSSSSTWCCRSSTRSSRSPRRSSSPAAPAGRRTRRCSTRCTSTSGASRNFDMGYASAMAWLLLVIIAAFTADQLLGLEVLGLLR